jgi:N utilization substance protein B
MIEGGAGLKTSDFKLARKYAVQFLYQQDINQQLFLHEQTLRNFIEQSEVAQNQREFLKSFLHFIFKSLEKVDALIEKYAKNWKISRIAKVDLAVLRVAIVELIERVETDIPVIISEAASIAQEYGSANSPLFVNGILDAISKEVRKKSL